MLSKAFSYVAFLSPRRNATFVAARDKAESTTLTRGDKLRGLREIVLGDASSLGALGLPSGVIFFLQTLLESGLLFAVIFLIFLPLMHDNEARNALRNECRAAISGDGSMPTGGCGYTGLPIASNPPAVKSLSMMSYGACEEYTKVGDDKGQLDYYGLFVEVDEAPFCAAGGTAAYALIYWFADLLLLLAFVVRLGKLADDIEDQFDKGVWTTSDYAVELRGLDRGVSVDEVEAALYADLAALGLGPGKINHMELGVRVSSGGPAALPPADAAGSPQLSTGHAFVVLQLEVDRNALLDLRGKFFPSAARQAGGKGVTAGFAPAPSNVCWAALEMEEEERARRKAETFRGVLILLGVSAVALVLIQWAKRTFTTDFKVGALGEGLGAVGKELANPSVVICLLCAGTIAAVGCRVRGTITAMHEAEGHQTLDDAESGLLFKLGGAFVCNVVIMPVVVSCMQSLLSHGALLSQALYERTEFLVMATVIMSIQRVTGDIPRALQAVSLIKRHCVAPCSASEKLKDLWTPPAMRIALQMAQLYWLHACAILYGPLAPFFYGLAAAYGLFSFACTRFGVVFWYTRPPAITAKLSHHFRLMILLLLPPHLLIKLLVRIAAEPSAYWPVSCAYFLVGLGLCWLVYRKSVIGGGGVFGQILGTEPAAYEQLNGLDTEGVRYDEVEAAKGYPIDSYVNPYRRRTTTRTRNSYFGAEAPPSGGVQGSAETIDQNSAVLSSSLPLDSMTFDITFDV